MRLINGKRQILSNTILLRIIFSIRSQRIFDPEVILNRRNSLQSSFGNQIGQKPRLSKVYYLTAALTKEPTLEDKVKLLIEISFIGLPMASAILAVCYPDDFTVVDYRAIVSLKSLGQVVLSNPSENLLAYLAYNQICKERAIEVGCSLRNFDRYLWAKVFYEGINGLKVLAHGV